MGDREYRVAEVLDTGAFGTVEEFYADSDEAANTYAGAHYPDLEWYVLDGDGDNING